MRPRQVVATAILVLLCAVLAVPQSTRTRTESSTAEERQRALQLTKKLEQHPFGPDAVQDRLWLANWILEIPDITVPVCEELLRSPLLGTVGRYRYALELVAQGLGGGVSYMIQHPQPQDPNEQDDFSINKASVESMLRAYEAMVRSGTKGAQWAPLEELLKKRNAGTLDEYVRQATLKCLAGPPVSVRAPKSGCSATPLYKVASMPLGTVERKR